MKLSTKKNRFPLRPVLWNQYTSRGRVQPPLVALLQEIGYRVEGLIALLQTLIQEVTELVDSRVDLMTLREALHIVDLLLQDTLSRLSSNCSLDLYLVIPAGFTTIFYTYPPLDHLLVNLEVKKALCF